MTELEKSLKNLKSFENKIEELIAKMDLSCGKIEAAAFAKISDCEEMENKIGVFYRNLGELDKAIKKLPDTVESHLEGSISRNMIKLSEHVFEEMRSASKTYSDELNAVASRYEKAVDRLDTRLGWRAYAPPLVAGFVAFFMSFSLIWWLELGVTKLDTQYIARLENLGAAFYNCSPEDEKKVREIFKKSKQKRE